MNFFFTSFVRIVFLVFYGIPRKKPLISKKHFCLKNRFYENCSLGFFSSEAILNVSKMGSDSDSVSKASPSPTTLCPVGSHPRSGLMVDPGIPSRRASSLCT
jgi:hypothetical protein